MTERKTHILDTAEGLFAKHGFDATTTRLISDTAEANIAMISYYFGGKERLLKAILDRFAENIFSLISKIEEKEDDPQERLQSWVISYLDYVFQHPNAVIIAHRQLNLITEKPELFQSTRDAYGRIFQQVHLTLDKGKHAGVFQDIDTELTIITLKSTIETLVLESQIIKQDFEITSDHSDSMYPDSFKKRVKDHMLALLEAFVFSN